MYWVVVIEMVKELHMLHITAFFKSASRCVVSLLIGTFCMICDYQVNTVLRRTWSTKFCTGDKIYSVIIDLQRFQMCSKNIVEAVR